ncbi:hypothetical protein EWJ91_03035 [Salmonella enterica subsp. enterica serovar Ouagadougou]|uniref:Uncharacterized protein n=1 Tax=Salmonella enterica subsp. enterica serovar Ouagadougou TaxID=2564899 RepID=A0A5I0CTB9_SALET|nr:hypothetical protein [Salmonella enterica subsp. enterica serovar Ouagadougou]EBR9511144.1 hypothetical protein [Salmonella enterica subsp. enterica serovar Ouagadougou]EBV0634380.1 hypothetical protein [Salmonella enterica subsp. enterica serovar Ouagadougou]EBV0752973.1 hypothetical protein [Salmonella enterica subsp. enterica serovar Ouagadougou]EBV0943979.1 hypothetical protein [Salmonella enterica subsp. enterica serovar Ouagadougou]
MSGSFRCNDDGWTEDEIACGLPFAVEHGYWAGDERTYLSKGAGKNNLAPKLNKTQNYIATSFELMLSKAIYPLNNRENIQQKIAQKLIQHGLSIAIRRYGRMESLPRRYQLLAQNRDCLTLLIRDFFLRVELMTLTPNMSHRIDQTIAILEKKDSDKIAYQRVGMLRDFIYQEVEQAKGKEQSLLCAREEMRLLLSTARLHLCINELTKHHSLELVALQKRYIGLAAIEAAMPTANTLPGKRNIYRWRLRHYRSLLYYFPLEIRKMLLEYMQKQNNFADNKMQNITEYKRALVTYCRQGIENYLCRKESAQRGIY